MCDSISSCILYDGGMVMIYDYWLLTLIVTYVSGILFGLWLGGKIFKLCKGCYNEK
jgi:hypothetical protein